MVDMSKLRRDLDDLDRYSQEIEKNNDSRGYDKDSRFWEAEVDSAGNGSATIRFLPAAEEDGDKALPWVKLFTHFFKGPTGKYYVENSLTTLGRGHRDPLSEYNSYLWNQSQDDNSPQRKQARTQKRKLEYISNIYVVNDPKNPENNGKVFLFKYGKKIFDKISNLMNPEFKEDTRINPFNLWNGANFKLRIRKVDGYTNYEQSSFDNPSALADSDEELAAIYAKTYPLLPFKAPDKFKSYEELKANLDDVMGFDTSVRSNNPNKSRTETSSSLKDDGDFLSETMSKPRQKPSTKDDDDDDDLDVFRSLAE